METNEQRIEFFNKTNKVTTLVNVGINILFLSFLMRYIGPFEKIFANLGVAIPVATQFFLEGAVVLMGISIAMIVIGTFLMISKPDSSQTFFINTTFIGIVILLTYTGILSMLEPLIMLMDKLK